MHGQWVEHPIGADGSVVEHNAWEGPYVDGKKHGKWVYRDPFVVGETHYVDNKKHGKSVARSHDGGYCAWGEYSHGEEVSGGFC